jgi:sulfite reductase (ferredoxin)
MSKQSVEAIKIASNGLRGSIPEELAAESDHVSEESYQLLKFHGTYQQDDRDSRKTARDSGAGKDYMFMIRTKNPGGYVPARQWSAIDDLTDRYGNGTIRITTRAGLQLHGVRKSNLREVIKQINDHLGSTLGACGDINRNVTASPFPFATPPYRATREAAHRIAELLTPRATAYYEIWQDGEKAYSSKENDEPIYGKAFLPRKFKIGVATPGDNSIDLFTNDLGVVPVLAGDDVVAYNLAVGGGLGMTHGKKNTYPRLADPIGSVPHERLLDAVRAIVVVQRDHGDRTDRRHARLKYLIDDRGLDWFRSAVEAEAGFRFNPWRPLPAWSVPTYSGWNEQGDGNWFFALDVLSGRVQDTSTVRTKTALREIADRGHDMVATPIQNVLIVGVSAEEKPHVDAILRKYGVRERGGLDAFGLRALACPALPTCGLSLAESERVLPALLGGLRDAWNAADLELEAVPTLRMTGCPNGCARPYMGEIGVVGVSLDRYNVYLGGNPESTRLNVLYREKVPLGEIPAVVQPLFEAFARERRANESFGDYCVRTAGEPEREPVGV